MRILPLGTQNSLRPPTSSQLSSTIGLEKKKKKKITWCCFVGLKTTSIKRSTGLPDRTRCIEVSEWQEPKLLLRSSTPTAPARIGHILAVQFKAVRYVFGEHGPAMSEDELTGHFVKRLFHIIRVLG